MANKMSLRERLKKIEGQYRTARMLHSSAEIDVFNFDDAEREALRNAVEDCLQKRPLIKNYLERGRPSLVERAEKLMNGEMKEYVSYCRNGHLPLSQTELEKVYSTVHSSETTRDISDLIGENAFGSTVIYGISRSKHWLFEAGGGLLAGFGAMILTYELLLKSSHFQISSLQGFLVGMACTLPVSSIGILGGSLFITKNSKMGINLENYAKAAREAQDFLDKDVRQILLPVSFYPWELQHD